MKLGKLLKSEGRSQQWLQARLKEKGVDRETSTINQWCTGKRIPPDDYILTIISEILGVKENAIFTCFGKDVPQDNNKDEMTF